jgi:hypothetical protein
MALIPGSVRVAGFIAPTDSTDTYAVTDELYNRGGYRTVLTLTERNDITADRRKIGMLVFVLGTNEYYTLKTGLTNSDWELWAPGGGGGSGTTNKVTATIGNGTDTEYEIIHSLNTLDVLAQVRDATTNEVVSVDIQNTDVNTTTVKFYNPPSSNAYRVVIIG